jgi:threonine aldolase
MLIFSNFTPLKSKRMINLMSDTVTKPTKGMLRAMFAAEVGDDVFQEDPTVNRLEKTMAEMFGKQAALYCPSGTMSNQIAIKTHTQPMDELICEESSHVFQYENGGYAFHSGIAVNLLQGKFGKITAAQVEAAIKPEYDWLPRTRLVVLENTGNKAGGSYYTLPEIDPITALCHRRGLKLHLDGARIFNALVETGESTQEVGKRFDSISVCLSKGLGAPVGSVLLGTADFIKKARRMRKAFGGGMRQAGYLAAAGLYALENHIPQLKKDNDHAKMIGKVLETMPIVENMRPIQTNIVIFDVKSPMTGAQFLEKLLAKGVKGSLFGVQTVRLVFHLDVTPEMVSEVSTILSNF